MWYYILMILCVVASVCVSTAAEEKGRRWGEWIFAFGVAAGIFLLACIKNESPTPIDVYRNKTTLEITYKDGVTIDSVVVFKDKEK
jgi:hypothetical protein